MTTASSLYTVLTPSPSMFLLSLNLLCISACRKRSVNIYFRQLYLVKGMFDYVIETVLGSQRITEEDIRWAVEQPYKNASSEEIKAGKGKST